MDKLEWHEHVEKLMRANCALNAEMFLELVAAKASHMLILEGRPIPSWSRCLCPQYVPEIFEGDEALFALHASIESPAKERSTRNFLSAHLDSANNAARLPTPVLFTCVEKAAPPPSSLWEWNKLQLRLVLLDLLCDKTFQEHLSVIFFQRFEHTLQDLLTLICQDLSL